MATLDDAILAARIDDAWLVSAARLLGELPDAGLPIVTRAIDIARTTRQDRMIPMLAGIRSMSTSTTCSWTSRSRTPTPSTGARDSSPRRAAPPRADQPAIVLWLRGERAEAARCREECHRGRGALEPSTLMITSLCNAAAPLVDEDPERCIREMTAAAGPLLERADRSWSTLLLACSSARP